MRERSPRQLLVVAVSMIWLAVVIGFLLVGAMGLAVCSSLSFGGVLFPEFVRLLTKA